MRLALIIEDDKKNLKIGKPKVSVIELKGKNAVVIDLQVEPKKNFFLSGKFKNYNLNLRQSDFLDSLDKASVTNREYRQFFKNNISTETARSDLLDLVKKGIFTRKGGRKNTVYLLNKIFIKNG